MRSTRWWPGPAPRRRRGAPPASLHAIAVQSDIRPPAGPPCRHRGPRAGVSKRHRRRGGAKTLFYPNVSLTAFVGTQSLGLDNLPRATAANGARACDPPADLRRRRLRAKPARQGGRPRCRVESYNARRARRGARRGRTGQQRAVGGPPADAAARCASRGEVPTRSPWQRYRAGLGTTQRADRRDAVLAQRRLAVDLAPVRSTRQVGRRARGRRMAAERGRGRTAPTHP